MGFSQADVNTMTVEGVCRTCLGSSDLRPLHPHTTISEELHMCTGLKIDKDDGLPQSICSECVSAVDAAILFRSRSRAAERKLQSQLKYAAPKPYKRICFDDEKQLKLLTQVKQERLKEEKTYEVEIKEEAKVEFEGEEHSALIVRFPDDVFEVTAASRIDDLLDSLLSELIERKSVNVTNDETIKKLPELPDFEVPFNDLPSFDDTDDYSINLGDDGPKKLEETKDECKQTKPKLTRLDLIDGAPNRCGPNKCRLCKKVSPNLKAFYKHLNSKHFGNKKAILCEFCAMRFADNQKLLRHCRARHGLERDNSFPCAYCPYRALDKEQLDVHERRVHTKERPFVCDNCGAGFFSKRVLIQHSRNHTDDKPYQCDKCPSKFKTRQRLCGHNIKIHVRRFTYACPVCDKRLSKSPYIRRHLLKEHGVPPDKQGRLLKVYLDQ